MSARSARRRSLHSAPDAQRLFSVIFGNIFDVTSIPSSTTLTSRQAEIVRLMARASVTSTLLELRPGHDRHVQRFVDGENNVVDVLAFSPGVGVAPHPHQSGVHQSTSGGFLPQQSGGGGGIRCMTYNIDAEVYCPAKTLPLKAKVLCDIIAKERLDLVVIQEFASDGGSVKLEAELKARLPPGWCLVVVYSAGVVAQNVELNGEVREEGDRHAFVWDPSRLTLRGTPSSHHRSRHHFKRPPVVADFAINRGGAAAAGDPTDGTLTEMLFASVHLKAAPCSDPKDKTKRESDETRDEVRRLGTHFVPAIRDEFGSQRLASLVILGGAPVQLLLSIDPGLVSARRLNPCTP